MIEEDRTHHLETFKANMWDIGARLEVRSEPVVTQLVLKRPNSNELNRGAVVFTSVAILILFLYLGLGGQFASTLIPVVVAILGAIGLSSFFAGKTKHLPRESVLLVWDANQQKLEAPMLSWRVALDQMDGLGLKSVFAKGFLGTRRSICFQCLYVLIQGRGHLIYATPNSGLHTVVKKFSATTAVPFVEAGAHQTASESIEV